MDSSHTCNMIAWALFSEDTELKSACIAFWLLQKWWMCVVVEDANPFLTTELWILNERILGSFPDGYYFENSSW